MNTRKRQSNINKYKSLIVIFLILSVLFINREHLRYKYVSEWTYGNPHLELKQSGNNDYTYFYHPSSGRTKIKVTWFGDTIVEKEVRTDCFAMYRLAGYETNIISVDTNQFKIIPRSAGMTKVLVERFYDLEGKDSSVADSFIIVARGNVNNFQVDVKKIQN